MPDDTPDDTIEELLGHIQKLSNDQLKAFQDAVYVGMNPKVAGECELRRELISKLVDRLAGLYKQPGIHASGRNSEPKKAA
jgi:hypothetical protein